MDAIKIEIIKIRCPFHLCVYDAHIRNAVDHKVVVTFNLCHMNVEFPALHLLIYLQLCISVKTNTSEAQYLIPGYLSTD